jgi:hypothetical protein
MILVSSCFIEKSHPLVVATVFEVLTLTQSCFDGTRIAHAVKKRYFFLNNKMIIENILFKKRTVNQ